ncbi:MAG: aldolase/citrate lyase family protein [Hyphomicrobiales bacterium]|nr:aldolase/citrate lyase family protein [Hyphomicrobiales bacterium]
MADRRDVSTAFSLAERLRAGKSAYVGWTGFPDPVFADAVARTALEAVVLDMQHGLIDSGTLVGAIAAIVAAEKPAVVRVPVEDFAMASRALDFGATGIIAPMINSAEDARRFVSFVKYPPRGRRSWGPGRSMVFSGVTQGADYLASADEMTLALAMIETREGLEALDEILAVDGIDGVFVGPNDLCIALTDGRLVDPEAALLDEPLARIVSAAKRAGKISGVFGGRQAARFRALGFDFVSVGFDTGYVAAGVAAMLGGGGGAGY